MALQNLFSDAETLPTKVTSHSIYQWAYERLPYRPHCGQNKMASLIQDRDKAIDFRYLVINPPTHIYWLTFDLDHTNSFQWQDAGLPSPNFIVRDPVSGHGHITYAIEPVCVSDKARQAPIHYMEAIRRTYARLLKADTSYTNRITKSPFCSHWLTTWLHDHTYSLGELSDYVDVLDAPIRHHDVGIDTDRRNCSIFNLLRQWAYQQVNIFKQHGDFNTWEKAVYEKAYVLARDIRCPKRGCINVNEADCIARSVSKWTWHHYRGQRHRPLDLDTSLSVRERQKLGAAYTHQTRIRNTEQRIKKAIKTLQDNGERVTKVAVAKQASISRQQLSNNYRYLFNESPRIPLKHSPNDHDTLKVTAKKREDISTNSFTNEQRVKFAPHQVTEPLKNNKNNKNNFKTENEWEMDWDVLNFSGDSKVNSQIAPKKYTIVDSCPLVNEKRYPKTIVDTQQEAQKLQSIEQTNDGIDIENERAIKEELSFYLDRLPKLDNLPPPFTPEFEVQLINCIIQERLTKAISVDIIIEIMAKVLEEPYQPYRQSLQRWQPYVKTIASRIR